MRHRGSLVLKSARKPSGFANFRTEFQWARPALRRQLSTLGQISFGTETSANSGLSRTRDPSPDAHFAFLRGFKLASTSSSKAMCDDVKRRVVSLGSSLILSKS